MNEIIVKNRSGWTLHEYIDIPEETHQDDVAIVKKIGLGEQECKSSIIESTERKIEII